MKRLKKSLGILLAAMLLLSFAVPALAAQVQVSTQTLTVNGVEVPCEKYNIDGSNYFKLRDLAYALNGTASSFAVGWDEANRIVSITTGQAYTPNGTELAAGADNSATAQVSAQTIMIDGKAVDGLAAYNIGGYNFFKLRDLGDALGFAVRYDEDTRTMVVEAEPLDEAEVYYRTGKDAYYAEDYETAIEIWTKGAELEYAPAQNGLGVCYYYGKGVEQDYTAATEWYVKAAEQGYPAAQFNLAGCYAEGLGVEQDDAEAFDWYMKAAEQGVAEAQASVGWYYEKGIVVQMDFITAFDWYMKAAEQGDMYAQWRVGRAYMSAKGVDQDYEAAVEWLSKAAEQGEPSALTDLGYLYAEGLGVEQDYAAAVELWLQAAEQGEPVAQFNLGDVYENGYGVVEPDPEQSEYWYGLAAAQGVTKEYLEELEAQQPVG